MYPSQKLEIIIVNDRSNDKTESLLKNWQKKISYLKWYWAYRPFLFNKLTDLDVTRIRGYGGLIIRNKKPPQRR